ncbi:MAG: DinB family protein [Gemmatimonadota bacterium]|nr:DinB family protein [Gemmatimonadota bacterium]
MAVLEAQLDDTLALVDDFSEAQSLHRYAPGKWSAREVMCHVNDTERLFAFRAFWFARGLDSPLPSFDQDAAVPLAGADDRSWASHIEEFQTVRTASLTLFRSLPDDASMRRGVASGNPFTVRALAYICAGHLAHHVEVLKDRYR